MTKKTQAKAVEDDETPLVQLTANAIRKVVTHVSKQIDSGEVASTSIQALVSINRSLRRTELSPDDLDRAVRALDAKQRLDLMAEWTKLDSKKRSGLA